MDDIPPEVQWMPPVYDLSGSPSTRYSFQLTPDSRARSSSSNFARCAKIAPDGSSFIAQCEDQSLQIFDFPNGVAGPLSTGPADPPTTPLQPRLNLQQASPVVDFAWFPSASKLDPATCCFVSSVRECPVKLLDANTGKLRASYRIVDHRERQIAPHSLAFTFDGQRLYCGFEDAIEVFDVGRPGEGTRIHTSPSKKSKDGLKGIVSALAFSNDRSSDDTLFAAGSLTPVPGNIALFSDTTDEAFMFLGGGPRAGVTQLQFNFYRPHMLYAAYRGNANGMIYSWDIRSNVNIPVAIYDGRPSDSSVPVFPLTDTQAGDVHDSNSSPTARNQKSRFDLDIGGRYIGSGNWAGEVTLFDVETTEAQVFANPPSQLTDTVMDGEISGEGASPLLVKPTMRLKSHKDTVTSVAFQPWTAEMLTLSGSRHFGMCDEESSDSEVSDASDSEVENPRRNPPKRTVKTGQGPQALDNSIKLWNLAPSTTIGPATTSC